MNYKSFLCHLTLSPPPLEKPNDPPVSITHTQLPTHTYRHVGRVNVLQQFETFQLAGRGKCFQIMKIKINGSHAPLGST